MRIGLRVVARSLVGVLAFGAMLFLPAGTLAYWQAWAFLFVFVVATVGPSLYLLKKSPETLRRRMRAGPAAETRPVQRVAISVVFPLFLALILFSAFDHRFGWSPVPPAIALLGNALVAAGLGLAMAVVVQNSFAAANVRVEAGQQVIASGLYGLVRHPMYLGSLIMTVGIPLALGSWWGVLGLLPGRDRVGVPHRRRRADAAERVGGLPRIHAKDPVPAGAVPVVNEGANHFEGRDLESARFEGVRLVNASFHDVDLGHARFRLVDMRGVRIRGARLHDVDISGWIDNLRVNGVDVVPLVEAELDRRHPERAKMRPADPKGFVEAWDIIERLWQGAVTSGRRWTRCSRFGEAGWRPYASSSPASRTRNSRG